MNTDQIKAEVFMRTLFKYLLVFLAGSIVYSCLEIAFRGFTHWTMFLAGGICFSILFPIFTKKNRPSIYNCLIGSGVITFVEFLFGCVFNLLLGWRIWDYSHFNLHLFGQICLPFTAIWFFLSLPIIWASRIIHSLLFTPKYP